MSALRPACAMLLVLVLAACARVPGGGMRLFQTGPDAGAQLVFLDRLAVASATELTDLGAELRAVVDDRPGTAVSLRYALWLATPGHPAYDPGAAQRRLEALLVDAPRIDRQLRALVRLQLRHLRQRVELTEHNQLLSSENARLREQIRALTALEEEMGRGEQSQ